MIKKSVTAAAVYVIVFACALAGTCVCAHAREQAPRRPFSTQYEAIADKEATFTTDGAWIPYPKYTDREAWNELLGREAARLIKAGEAKLGYQWEITTAMDFLEMEKDGNRRHHKAKQDNDGTLGVLVMAELAEGKGRFIPQIINGVWFAAERLTWQYVVHQRNQPSHRQLPEDDQRYITLGSASQAAEIAITWRLFHEEFDKYDPSISRTVLEALDKNTFGPYLDASKDKAGHGWTKGRGNWSTYCNAFVMQAFLFAQQDKGKLLSALEKGMKVADNYMDWAQMDGACEEGPSYWGMAGCKAYELAKLMYDASKGQMNLFGDPQLRNMCIWKSSIDLGDGWTVNYGDGGPRSQGGSYCLFRMGAEMDIQELKDLSVYLACNFKKEKFGKSIENGGDLFRDLESARYRKEFVEAGKDALNEAGGDWELMRRNLRRSVTSMYYPDTQTAVLRNAKGWILAPKAGFNEECHNHNDVGNFILFYDECPVLIDQGAGRYDKTTFSKQRYTANYHINSYGHNVPVINGEPQSNGKQFAARNVSCDLSALSFTSDISGAYAEDADVKSWVRCVKLEDKGAVITDDFRLGSRKAADDLHFISWGEAKVVKPGLVTINARDYSGGRHVTVKLTYSKNLEATVTPREMTNINLKKRWGTLYEISLKSKNNAPLKGTYRIKISK